MRSLIITDNFDELKYIKALFSKLGLPLEAATTLQLVPNILSNFKPNIIIVSGQSKKINGIETVENLDSKNKGYKFIYLKSLTAKIDDRFQIVDVLLDSPVSPKGLIKALVKVSDYDVKTLEQKLSTSENSSEPRESDRYPSVLSEEPTEYSKQFVEGRSMDYNFLKSNKDERKLRYDEILKNLKPINKSSHFEVDKIKKSIKENQSEEVSEEEHSINEQKKLFVDSLFSKKDK